MFRSGCTLPIASLAVFLAGCAGPTAEQWHRNQDIGMGVSLSYPSTFVPENVFEGEIVSGTGTLRLQQVRLRRGQGTEGTIMMMRSDSRSLLASLQADHPLERVTVGGRDLQKFMMDGTGNPVGFVLQEEPSVVAVAFANMEDQEVIEEVLESITVEE